LSALDLLRTRALAIRYARPATAYCKAAGVDWLKTEAATGGLFLAPVLADPPRSFLIDPAGSDAVVIDALGEDGSVVDLVSWRPGFPANWRTFSGRASTLGLQGATVPFTFNDPLRLWRTPERWLQVDCRGVVPLDLARTIRWLLDHDGMVSTLAPEDEDHAAEVAAARRTIINGQRIVVPARARVSEAA
jgi:hypothetical protein